MATRKAKSDSKAATAADFNGTGKRSDAPRNGIDSDAERRELGQRIFKETVIFRLRQRKPGWRVRLSADEIDALTAAKEKGEIKEGDEFDKALLTAYKELLGREAFRPVRALDKAFRDYLKVIELQQSIVGGGQHLIPWRFVTELRARYLEYKAQREALVETFLTSVYEDAKREAKGRLGNLLFKESQYPTPGQVRAATELQEQWTTMDVPQALKKVDAALFDEVKNNFNAEWGNAAEEMKTGLRCMFQEIIQRAATALQVTENGKPRRFNDSMVEAINDFARTFEGRNFASDDELRALVDNMRDVMKGITPDQLRKDESVRETATRAIGEALEGIEKLVVDVERQLRLDDDDDDDAPAPRKKAPAKRRTIPKGGARKAATAGDDEDEGLRVRR